MEGVQMPNGRPTINELPKEDTASSAAHKSRLVAAGVKGLVYRILRDMMVEDEMDYETYKRFMKRFEAELDTKGGEVEETYIY
jgi:hypothetical protein